jgi:hypothetical protein
MKSRGETWEKLRGSGQAKGLEIWDKETRNGGMVKKKGRKIGIVKYWNDGMLENIVAGFGLTPCA